MAWSLSAHTSWAGLNNPVTSSAVDTTGTNLHVVNTAFYVGDAAQIGLTDSFGNTFSPLTQHVANPDNVCSQLWYVANPVVGAGHTYTINGLFGSFPTAPAVSAEVQAFSGAAASPFDVESGAANTSNVTSLAPGAVTPTQDGELVVSGLCVTNDDGAGVTNSSFTISDAVQGAPGNYMSSAMGYVVLGAGTGGSSYTPNAWGWTNARTSAASIAAFQVAASGPVSLVPGVHIQPILFALQRKQLTGRGFGPLVPFRPLNPLPPPPAPPPLIAGTQVQPILFLLAGVAGSKNRGVGPFIPPVLPPGGGPAAYFLTLLGSSSVVASLSRQTGKALQASVSPISALVRSTGKVLLASSSVVASLSRQTGKALQASVSPISSLVRSTGKVLLTSSSVAGSLSRQTGKAVKASVLPLATLSRAAGKLLTGATPPMASLVRSTGKILSGASSPIATRQMQTGKALSASTAPIASLAAVRAVLLTLQAAAGAVASLSRQTGKMLQASTSPVGVLARAAAKVLLASVAPAAALTRATAKVLQASVAPLAVLSRLTAKTLQALAGAVASLTNVSAGPLTPDPRFTVKGAKGRFGVLGTSGTFTVKGDLGSFDANSGPDEP